MNKYICRGVIKSKNSKIKRFAYGYYVKIEGRHYLILDDVILDKNEYNLDVISEANFVEIVKEPDMFIGEVDGVMRWENE